MSIPTEDFKEPLRQRNWKKTKAILDTLPIDANLFETVFQLVWFSDSMVRRRPGDDGVKRDSYLAELGKYFQERGVHEAVDSVAEARTLLLKIDRGYEEIHAVVPRMKSATFRPEERISGAFAALDYGLRQTLKDSERKLKADNGLIGINRNLLNTEQQSYDPNATTHGLSIAGGDILMLEAYRAEWFDSAGRIVLPDLPPASDEIRDATVANLGNANMWRLWKHIDERVRFLNGNLDMFSQEHPDWVAQFEAANPDVKIDVSFEFFPDITSEQFDLLANERLDQVLEQNFYKLLVNTNARTKVSKAGVSAALPPKGWVSIDEIHAASMILLLTKADDLTIRAGKLQLSERLRGYAVLKLLLEQFEAEQKTYFPRVARTRLLSELSRYGLPENSAAEFIDLATFKRSSRDLYDQPLVKSGEEHLILFGSSLLFADLTKIFFSSLANEEISIAGKGKHFEKATIALLKSHGFNARTLTVRRGPDKKEEYDYDVAFTWDDYVFFLECKNRGIPMGNPIATYRFNQEMYSHLQQVQRLRQGLIDFPDILEKDFPEAVGKKPVFCLVNAMPFSMGKIDEIFFIDDSIFGRFFSSPTIKVAAASVGGTGPRLETKPRKLWVGTRPTAAEFIAYMTAPPQLEIASKQYEINPKLEALSLGAFAKVNDFRRKDLDAAAIDQILQNAPKSP